MHLTSSGGSLALRPLGYRFAVPRGDHYDDNWLTIAGRVTAPAGAWKFQEPALLTDEAERLTRWLRATAAGRTPVAVPARTPGHRPSSSSNPSSPSASPPAPPPP